MLLDFVNTFWGIWISNIKQCTLHFVVISPTSGYRGLTESCQEDLIADAGYIGPLYFLVSCESQEKK